MLSKILKEEKFFKLLYVDVVHPLLILLFNPDWVGGNKMNFKQLLKKLGDKETITLHGRRGDKVIVSHNYDYVYTIKLNKTTARDFLLSEAVAWLDFYESKRGALRLEEQVESQGQNIANIEFANC